MLILLGRWLLPAGILMAAGALVFTVRRGLRHYLIPLHSKITPLGPPSATGGTTLDLYAIFHSLTAAIYIVGLHLFLDLVPLEGAAYIWLEHAVYVFTVGISLLITHQIAMVGAEWLTVVSARSNAPAVGEKHGTLELGFLPLFQKIIRIFIVLTGAIMVLTHFHYDVLSLLTALGVGSLAVGLAAKETLANMISGFTLIIDKNLKPQDQVRINTLQGQVQEIGLRSTKIRMEDGNLLIVPNSDLVNTKIIQLSLPPSSVQCKSLIHIGLEHRLELINELSLQCLNQLTYPLDRLKPYRVHLLSLEAGHQRIQISFWIVRPEDADGACSKFNEHLLQVLRQHNITLTAMSPSATLPPGVV